MIKKDSAQRSYKKWVIIGLVSVIIGAPNSTIVKGLFGELNSTSLAFLKFAMMMVVFLPAVIIFIMKNKEIFKKNILNLALSAVGTASSVFVFYKAIELSTASYASIVSLLSPIILVLLSNKLIKEKVVPRAVAGVTLAAIGGLLIVALPAMLHGSAGSEFYPMATVLVLISCIGLPISVIYQRKSNEGGVPFSVYAGFTAVVVVFAVLIVSVFESGGVNHIVTDIAGLSFWGWAAVVYSAFVVSFMSRTLWIKSYEHMGSAVSSGLSYLETLMGIVLPMLIFNEKLSTELIIGALMVMIGVYLTESRPRGGRHHYSTHLHYLHRHSQIR